MHFYYSNSSFGKSSLQAPLIKQPSQQMMSTPVWILDTDIWMDIKRRVLTRENKIGPKKYSKIPRRVKPRDWTHS